MRSLSLALATLLVALGTAGCGDERVTQELGDQLARHRRVGGVFDFSREALARLDIEDWYSPEKIPDGSD